jgi:hypothetical protein
MTFSCTNDSPKEVTPLKSIVDIAKADPANFSILVDALKKTGLDATLMRVHIQYLLLQTQL